MYNSDRRNSSRRSSQHIRSSQRERDYLEEEPKYVLPRNGWIYAIIIGLVGGVIALVVPVTITLINASLLNQAASAASKGVPYQTALPLLGWVCSGAFVELVIAFAVGIVAGRIVVKRWLGAVAGAVAGAIVSFGIFLSHYIPGYPGVITTSTTSPWLQYVGGFIILLLIYAPIGGLMSLGGTWVITRTHPDSHRRLQE